MPHRAGSWPGAVGRDPEHGDREETPDAGRSILGPLGLVIEEFEPAPELRGVVHSAADFYERSTPRRRLEAPFVGVVLIVSLGPDMEIDGRPVGSFVAGVWDRPTVTGHFGEQAGYQLYLDVLGARRLLGVPAGDLGNRLVCLEDVLGGFASELAERLGNAPDPEERHAVAQRLLTERLSEDHAAPQVAYALARLQGSRGTARVETLAAEVGWSRRHLAARFREAVGLPPKALARLIRVEDAVKRLRGGERLADVAYGAGYADQSHFNREFRQLVGCTPTEFPFVQDSPVGV